MATSITLTFLSRRFGAVPAVSDVSLTIKPGEMFYLLGPSGCGKTTLLRLIAGFIEPTAGEVWMGDQNVTRLPPARRGLSMVFQSAALWPHLSALDNVAMGLAGENMPGRERRRRAHEALDAVRLTACARRRPAQLSGGQQQRAALARAMIRRPEVLLLDEPLSSLDAASRRQLRNEIRDLCSSTGVTTLFVTHEHEAALRDADRLALMRRGRIEQVGTPSEMYRHPKSRFVAESFGENNILPATTIGEVAGQPGMIELDTPIGRLIAKSNADKLSDEKHVLCAIRPESIELTEDQRSCNMLYGKWLDESIGAGVMTRRLKVSDGCICVIGRCNGEGKRADPERVRISIDPAAIWILDENGESVR